LGYPYVPPLRTCHGTSVMGHPPYPLRTASDLCSVPLRTPSVPPSVLRPRFRSVPVCVSLAHTVRTPGFLILKIKEPGKVED
jgi:hypothetical protein